MLKTRILITGAGGFLGSRLCRILANSPNNQLSVLVRDPCKFSKHNIENVELIKGDVTSVSDVDFAVANCDKVIHLASGNIDAIVYGTQLVADACIKHGITQLIHLSSAAIYGIQSNQSHLNDLTPVEFNGNLYSDAKIIAEKTLNAKISSGLKFISLRPRVIWGPDSFWVKNMLPYAQLNTGFPLVGDGDGACNCIFVDNLIDAIRHMLDHNIVTNNHYYITDDAALTWKAFYRKLYRLENSDFVQSDFAKDEKISVGGKLTRLYLLELKLVGYPKIAKVYKFAKKVISKLSRMMSPTPKHTSSSEYKDSILRKARESGVVFTNIDRIKLDCQYVPKYSIDDAMGITHEWLALKRKTE